MAESDNKERGHSTTMGYYVEGRVPGVLLQPQRLGYTYLTKEWQRVSWPTGAGGIPNHLFNPLAAQHGILTYTAAHTLMAGAVAERAHGELFVEYRLRKVEMVCDWHINDLGVGRTVNFFEAERGEEFSASPEPANAD